MVSPAPRNKPTATPAWDPLGQLAATPWRTGVRSAACQYAILLLCAAVLAAALSHSLAKSEQTPLPTTVFPLPVPQFRGDLSSAATRPEPLLPGPQVADALDSGLHVPPPGPAGPPSPPSQCSQCSPLLQEHLAFPQDGSCGAWASEYAELHDKIRRGALPPRYATYENVKYMPGLGDRMVGMVSTFLVALLTDRAFIIADPMVATAFQPAVIDWRIRGDVPIAVTTSNISEVQEGSVLRVYATNGERSGIFPACPGCRSLVGEIFKTFNGTQAAANIIVHANRGVLAEILSDRKLREHRMLRRRGLRVATAFSCIMRFLLRPRREIMELASGPAQELLSPATESICLHLRTDDRFAWPDGSLNATEMEGLRDRVQAHLGPMVSCALRLEGRQHWFRFWRRKPLWFVMSDSDTVIKSLRQVHGDKILTSGIEPLHPKYVGQDGLVRATVDWLIFTTCNSYVIVQSGLSKTAFATNPKAPPLFMFDRMDYPSGYPQTCQLHKPDTILSLGGWSGV